MVTPSTLRWVFVGLMFVTVIMAASCGSTITTTTTPSDANSSTQAATTTAPKDASSSTQAATTTTTTPPAATTTTAKYEVVEKNQNGAKLVINVYTKEKTAAGLVKINDELLKNNLANNDTLLFNYFNDKETAKTYFNKIASASDSEADAMATHYIAYLRYYTAGVKEFTQNQDGSWVVIKSY
jgi:hypothetical protein